MRSLRWRIVHAQECARACSGWAFFRRKAAAPLRFGDIFDAGAFALGVSPCSVVDDLPLSANLSDVRVVPINVRWNFTELLPWVYAALRPSQQMRPIVNRLRTMASALAGDRWAGVHLRIESDWWYISGFCNQRRHHAKRCYTPDEVAQLTRPIRAAQASTGTVLFYAANLVSKRGPVVNTSSFGPRTIKMSLPQELPYTMQAAVELFLAASSVGGFFGNSFSTFSKGVALMRRVQAARDAGMLYSYSYDCGGYVHASASKNSLLLSGRDAPHQLLLGLVEESPLLAVASPKHCLSLAKELKAAARAAKETALKRVKTRVARESPAKHAKTRAAREASRSHWNSTALPARRRYMNSTGLSAPAKPGMYRPRQGGVRGHPQSAPRGRSNLAA
mmetsp:Transcript_633/g.1414  ORF Transcript_633/g.1414 Transcript_633/m.1414 type:complete len:391 (-) Transcript_633:181-1353(-)|eukprot:CAMPEP_0119356236 /NCGR_PEP_ID=MMETSP1334-20130426/4886_1 /TAXON_ID=127549 /ORGANISM="Calcidiscus leptoporus, Strain RCC1130" /LENGTH=390 /DNA_ID=CAMNT_0007370225 /DNA_START=346 /DNA_END=1518 /DNA_ORIENTATION=-